MSTNESSLMGVGGTESTSQDFKAGSGKSEREANAIDAYRVYSASGFRGLGSAYPYSVIHLSINAGRKIELWVAIDDKTVYRVFARTGRDPWNTCDAWLTPDGSFSGPHSGPAKLSQAIKELSERISTKGLKAALAWYGEQSICCCCGANLTDPESILRGIGPECIKRIEAQILLRYLLA